RRLEPLADDPGFQNRFLEVKRENKLRLASEIRDSVGLTVDVGSLFDVQIKRIHEYKRQLLDVLHVIHRYLCIVEDGDTSLEPRTFVFAGKAAPGYQMAKRIIKLINN